jgi:hypothetical protein
VKQARERKKERERERREEGKRGIVIICILSSYCMLATKETEFTNMAASEARPVGRIGVQESWVAGDGIGQAGR